MLPLIAFLQLQAATVEPVHGRGAPDVVIPRLEEVVEIDGRLDEPAWSSAARLTGFHQYQPVAGRPAEERTEVLVWYSPRAIHFGIIAHARDPRTIRATLAERDAVDNDDRVTLFLDTFLDRRRAFFFTVNPLGVQGDGVRTEGAVSAANTFGGSVDRNPDFLFDSRGQVTDSGYVVEIRIPFTSLRFAGSGEQRWGLQVVRDIPATGYQDTWTDVRQSASFLAQSGTLVGLRDLERGVVTELQPFITATSGHERDPITGKFRGRGWNPNAGANLRLGFARLAVDATLNPDFSQVESDAGLVTVNQRFALFIPEKRPFFLEGIELFATPQQLVYTRRIGSPVVGGKITGKFGPYSVAYLAALDEASGLGALFNVARVRRDFGGNSVAALTLTSREHAGSYNRVAAADARVVFGGVYYVETQLGGSITRDGAARPRSGDAIWKAEFDRTGRQWGFNLQMRGVGEEFEAHAGFIPRNDIISAHAYNRFTWYGARGSLVESFTTFHGPRWIWRHDMLPSGAPLERNEHVSGNLRLRGGWNVNAAVNQDRFAFDARDYAGLEVVRGDVADPFVPASGASGLRSFELGASTPVFHRFNASATVGRGGTPIFAEASVGLMSYADASLSLRPTASLRVEGNIAHVRIDRARHGSEYARALIPRLRLEYQLTRATFVRTVGEYRSERTAALIHPRNGSPLLLLGQPVPGREGGAVRLDWLLAYQPSPGTVAYLGYGSSHAAPTARGLGEMRRSADGIFLKLAYQFRR